MCLLYQNILINHLKTTNTNKMTVKSVILPDRIGIIASSLCMVHCIATPFLFLAGSSAAIHTDTSPEWWHWMDYLFLFISFIAVWQTSKTSSKNWVKYALWSSWLLLFAAIMNEKLALLSLPEITIYIPAIALVVFHFYNLKNCQCSKEGCCTNQS